MLSECPNCGYKPCTILGCNKHAAIDNRCVEHHKELLTEEVTDIIRRELDSNLGRANSDD